MQRDFMKLENHLSLTREGQKGAVLEDSVLDNSCQESACMLDFITFNRSKSIGRCFITIAIVSYENGNYLWKHVILMHMPNYIIPSVDFTHSG